MIVWSEKEGHRRQRLTKQMAASGELGYEDMGNDCTNNNR